MTIKEIEEQTYLTNFLCFIALSVEIFSVLFIYGIVKNVVVVLVADTVVFIGFLIVGIFHYSKKLTFNSVRACGKSPLRVKINPTSHALAAFSESLLPRIAP